MDILDKKGIYVQNHSTLSSTQPVYKVSLFGEGLFAMFFMCPLSTTRLTPPVSAVIKCPL